MGIPIEVFAEENWYSLHSGPTAPVVVLDDYCRQRLYDWFLLSSQLDRAIAGPLNPDAYGNVNNTAFGVPDQCRLQLLESRRVGGTDISGPRGDTLRFKQLNTYATLMYDMSWQQPMRIWQHECMRYVHMIDDIKDMYNLTSAITDVDANIQECDSRMIVTVKMEHNCICLMTYDLGTLKPCVDDCHWIAVPRNVGRVVSTVFSQHLPHYLLLTTERGLFCYSVRKECWYDLQLPRELCNRNYSYTIHFPQLLVSNRADCVWKVDNFLDKTSQVSMFDLTPILQDDELIEHILSEDLSQFTLETNRRLLSIGSLTTDYIDFRTLITKNSKATLAMHSMDMRRLILIERNLYSLSLSVLSRLDEANQYALAGYSDLQQSQLNRARASTQRTIHHAQYNEHTSTVTLYHSCPVVMDTFAIRTNAS